jgi:DNA-binding NarL/FixJ family response regulator
MNMLLPSARGAVSMKEMAIAVAVIDDDRTLLSSLRLIVDAAEGFRCAGAFASVEEALPHLRSINADVLLLDIQLPGMAGDEALGSIRALCPDMRILMLTVFSDRERLFTSICNGAHGYLLKSTSPQRLLDAIAAARDGGSPFSPEIARHIVSLFQKTGQPVQDAALTAQEQRLLALLTEGYSYQSAADRMNVSVNTVRNYIRSIYEKLHVHSKSEAVSKALRQGIIG